jgi:hypothetical protein
MRVRQVFLEGRPLFIFPCRADDKRPTCPGGFYAAVADFAGMARLWSDYYGPLVGVPTGAVNGISVIDVDPRNDGDKWYGQHRDRLPPTRTHKTRSGGLHLLYRHPPGLRCCEIAQGVDLKADGGYVIWWPWVTVEGPVVEFPAWLFEELRAGRKCSLQVAHEVVDEMGTVLTRREHLPLCPTVNLSRRTQQILRVVEVAKPGKRNKLLYWAACRLGEIMTEGQLRPRVAVQLLKSAAQLCGLVRDDGERAVMATILSGLRRGFGGDAAQAAHHGH